MKVKDLIKLLGKKPAAKLIKKFAGQTIYVPKGDEAKRRPRNKFICTQYRSGRRSAAALAKKFGISERQIFSILASEKKGVVDG